MSLSSWAGDALSKSCPHVITLPHCDEYCPKPRSSNQVSTICRLHWLNGSSNWSLKKNNTMLSLNTPKVHFILSHNHSQCLYYLLNKKYRKSSMTLLNFNSAWLENIHTASFPHRRYGIFSKHESVFLLNTTHMFIPQWHYMLALRHVHQGRSYLYAHVYT